MLNLLAKQDAPLLFHDLPKYNDSNFHQEMKGASPMELCILWSKVGADYSIYKVIAKVVFDVFD